MYDHAVQPCTGSNINCTRSERTPVAKDVKAGDTGSLELFTPCLVVKYLAFAFFESKKAFFLRGSEVNLRKMFEFYCLALDLKTRKIKVIFND